MRSTMPKPGHERFSQGLDGKTGPADAQWKGEAERNPSRKRDECQENNAFTPL
jgi:hypothetical protein